MKEGVGERGRGRVSSPAPIAGVVTNELRLVQLRYFDDKRKMSTVFSIYKTTLLMFSGEMTCTLS